MATINDLLYNYQDTNEFVCSDGRMSVNGICSVDQKDSVETSSLIKKIINLSKDGKDDYEKNKDYEEKYKNEKLLEDLEGSSDYFPDLGKEKKTFKWDMDKPSTVGDFTSTINNNITAYNNFIEENLGIPSGAQNAIRVGAWAIPFFAGGAINKAEKERIEKITDQDKQGGNINTVDMMTYDIPTAGQDGFNIHNDAKDERDSTPSGPSNQMESDFGYGSDAGFY